MFREQKTKLKLRISAVEKCRICHNPSLVPCVNLGAQYLSSIFPESLDYRSEFHQVPLDLVICERNGDSQGCGLVQLAHKLDLSLMYETYPYTSSTHSSMSSVLKDVVESALSVIELQSSDLILDIGGNDGTLLSFFQNRDFDLLCIDAAKNINPVIRTKNYTHMRNFFDAKVFAQATPKKAKLIFSIAMFYHLDDPVTFCHEVATCLDEEGVWIIQMAYLPAMLQTNMYDNIVHEHNGYYATQQMKSMMDKTDLEIFDVNLNNIYGGSFRLFVKKKGCRKYPVTGRYHKILREELRAGIFDLATYQKFMERVEASRTHLRELCKKLKAQSKQVWVYGAATKGNTILQFCGLGADDIVAAADSNPFKLGKYMIGSDIPIKDEAVMRSARPDYLLALPYSFIDGFLKRESDLVGKGTQFIVPLPNLHLRP